MDLNYTRDTTSGDGGPRRRSRRSARSTPTRRSCVMTAWGTIDLAVEGMRRGAQDFIEKPWDNERLLAVLRTQVALGRALQRARTLEAENRQLTGRRRRARSPSRAAMQPVLETDRARRADGCQRADHGRERLRQGRRRAADSRALAARASAASSPSTSAASPRRCSRARCSATSKARSRTRRTTASAASSSPTAARCSSTRSRTSRSRSRRSCCACSRTASSSALGSSRTQRVDVRVLAATNADIDGEIAAGRFRSDLLYPARTRSTSICRRCASAATTSCGSRSGSSSQHAQHHRRSVDGVQPSRAVGAAPLRVAGQRARAQSRRRARGADGARRRDRARGPAAHGRGGAAARPPGDDARRGRARCDPRALARHDGNVVAAADELGMSRSALYRRMEKFGCDARASACGSRTGCSLLTLLTVAPRVVGDRCVLLYCLERRRRPLRWTIHRLPDVCLC